MLIGTFDEVDERVAYSVIRSLLLVSAHVGDGQRI